jgi:hypothetical protein
VRLNSQQKLMVQRREEQDWGVWFLWPYIIYYCYMCTDQLRAGLYDTL